MPEQPRSQLVELARASQVSVTEVRRYARAGALIVTDEQVVTDRDVRRVRRVRRLRRDLGLDLESIGIIVRLVERLEELEATRR